MIIKMLRNKQKWQKSEFGQNKKKYKEHTDIFLKILILNNLHKNIKENH
jgi:hypothetical protein